MKLEECTWPQVETYLKRKKTILVPVGSCEQHGPTGLIGTDFLTAQAVSQGLADRTNTLIAPSLNFGMAEHHMAFPGTISLRTDTYINLVCDIVLSLKRHGFEELLFINGHGGNIAPITTAFCKIKSEQNSQKLFLENWWHLQRVRNYEEENFGIENGFHATVGEVSLTMHTNSNAFEKIEPLSFDVTGYSKTHWPQSAQEFRSNFPDGRMGSNPGLASKLHGQKIIELAIDELEEKYKGILT